MQSLCCLDANTRRTTSNENDSVGLFALQLFVIDNLLRRRTLVTGTIECLKEVFVASSHVDSQSRGSVQRATGGGAMERSWKPFAARLFIYLARH